MKILSEPINYLSGKGQVRFDKRYDYALFRQDWNSCETVLFNKHKIKAVSEKISDGEILIHRSYSVLYCRTKYLLKEVKDLWCYAVVFKK